MSNACIAYIDMFSDDREAGPVAHLAQLRPDVCHHGCAYTVL